MRWLPHLLILIAGLCAPTFAGDHPVGIGLMAMLVVVVGVPHGAVDHITYQHASGQRSWKALVRFFGVYLVGLGGFALLIGMLPLLATLLFLVLSAWHFGHSHLEAGRIGAWDRIHAFALGTLLLSALMLPHVDDSISVMENWLPAQQAAALLKWQQPFTLLAALFWAITGSRGPARRRAALREGILVLGVVFVSLNGGLAWAFVAYFCLGHSIDAWRTEFLFQQGLTTRFMRYYRESVPLTAAALVFMGLMAVGVEQAWWNWSWVWIATVSGTIPHMLFLDHWVPLKGAAPSTGRMEAPGIPRDALGRIAA